MCGLLVDLLLALPLDNLCTDDHYACMCMTQRKSDENVYLLAKCFHLSGRTSQAIAVLEGAQRPQNRYLLALCYFQQNKLVDAENALRGDGDHHFVDELASERIPNGAAGLYLLGRICRRANRREQAIDCFVKRCELLSTGACSCSCTTRLSLVCLWL